MGLNSLKDAPRGRERGAVDKAEVAATAVRDPAIHGSRPDGAAVTRRRGGWPTGDAARMDSQPLEALIFARPGEPGRIDHFTVLRLIGAGGMGVVYAAFDEELDRRVAIKVLRDDQQAGTDGRARMLREAQAMAKLSHPNVVQVYEVGEFGGQIFIAMEFIKGKSLDEWVTAEERGWEEVVEVFIQCGRGLAAAHRQGIVHRDFKPDNVLIDGDGTARVLDFGLARAGERAREAMATDGDWSHPGGRTSALRKDLTAAGTLMGTPAYMSPEQFNSGAIDWRSDQFSLCVAVYWAVYGQAPFGEDDAGFAELFIAVTGGTLRPPPADSKAPGWLFQALKTGLATEPDERHPSMDTLLAALAPDRAVSGVRRWLWPVATVVVAAMAVGVTLKMVRPADPTAADLATIERYVREAHEAAVKMQWVYPTPEDLEDTSYHRVVLLEALGGAAEVQGAEAASKLRGEFSEALVALGDRYFDDQDTRPFARDYYVQALLFMPVDMHARGRAGVTVGQLADLGQRAGSGEFFKDEVIAAEPLRILADPDRERARARASAQYFAQDGWTKHWHLTAMLREKGLLGATPAETGLAAPAPARAGESVAPVEVATAPVVGAGTRALAPTKAGESGAGAGNPVASRALSAEGDAAMQRGDTGTAAQKYKRALDLWTQNAAALIGLSDVAFDGGKFERAASYAEKAVRLEPNRGDYQLRLGDAYYKAFRYSEAEARYQRAVELKQPKASERLARVRAELGG